MAQVNYFDIQSEWKAQNKEDSKANPVTFKRTAYFCGGPARREKKDSFTVPNIFHLW